MQDEDAGPAFDMSQVSVPETTPLTSQDQWLKVMQQLADILSNVEALILAFVSSYSIQTLSCTITTTP